MAEDGRPHTIKLAWSVEGDILTTGRDFAGMGVGTGSAPDLMRGFVDAGPTG
jgi:hypothetical protein